MIRLTDEEIEKVKDSVGLTSEGNGIYSMHIYDEQRAIAEAQLKKVVEYLDGVSVNMPVGVVDARCIPENIWQALLEEVK